MASDLSRGRRKITAANIRYATTSLLRFWRPSFRGCPSCGSGESVEVSRKLVVTSLVRCTHCQLLYRIPTTPSSESERFYQFRYRRGVTTEMPNAAELAVLVDSGFRGSEKDYARYLAVLEDLGLAPGDRIVDYGCSWGYGAWQFRKAGFDVVGCEISRPRARYAAEALGCAIVNPEALGDESADVFFSAHVLEHVPSVEATLTLAHRVVRPGGYAVFVTPNGSDPHRRANDLWNLLWGQDHPNFLDDRYWSHQLDGCRFVLASSVDDPAATNRLGFPSGIGAAIGTHRMFALDGAELIAIMEKERSRPWGGRRAET